MARPRPRSLAAFILLSVCLLSWSCVVSTEAEAKPSGKRGHISERRSLDAGSGPSQGNGTDRSLLWGALIGDQINGEQVPWDMGGATELEAMLGKRMSLIHFMAPFTDCYSSKCFNYRFPEEEMQAIRDHGATPFFSWSSQSIPSREDEPDYQLSDVISGRYDVYIRDWAKDARQWGRRFFLRFNWEMNGDWFPWAEGANGNRPGEYVRAWRHVHDIFDEVGARNPIWVWCPNVDFEDSLQDLSSLYPGDDYVEWTCLDGYNWGTNPAKRDQWRTFDELYERTYREIVGRIAPGKPMVIGEIASTEQGGSKARWIAETLRTVPTRYPKIRALLWFDKFDSGMDWPLETSQSAVEAFRAGIRSRYFAAGG